MGRVYVVSSGAPDESKDHAKDIALGLHRQSHTLFVHFKSYNFSMCAQFPWISGTRLKSCRHPWDWQFTSALVFTRAPSSPGWWVSRCLAIASSATRSTRRLGCRAPVWYICNDPAITILIDPSSQHCVNTFRPERSKSLKVPMSVLRAWEDLCLSTGALLPSRYSFHS